MSAQSPFELELEKLFIGLNLDKGIHPILEDQRFDFDISTTIIPGHATTKYVNKLAPKSFDLIPNNAKALSLSLSEGIDPYKSYEIELVLAFESKEDMDKTYDEIKDHLLKFGQIVNSLNSDEEVDLKDNNTNYDWISEKLISFPVLNIYSISNKRLKKDQQYEHNMVLKYLNMLNLPQGFPSKQ